MEVEEQEKQEPKFTGPLATIYGWQVDVEGEKAKELLPPGDHNEQHRALLDIDLREIGEPAFPDDFCKSGGTCEVLDYPVIVQIQRVRNISAPKTNEESKYAPRMLKLTITDGHTTIQAIEVEHIPGLSINTVPGTKMQLKVGPVRSSHGFLFIEPNSVKLFGGHVTQMVEKWELNRSLAKHTRGGGGGDNEPPPWIPFGQPLYGKDPLDKAFKSLQDEAKLENPEFEAQRKGAIAEAQKMCGTKKVFGGGTKPMLDANVQKIVDAGFSEEQAENALKIARNNAGRALKNLQKREVVAEVKKEKQTKPPQEGGGKGRKGRGKEHTDEEGTAAGKPSGKVSLFDFLEDKLPVIPESEKTKPESLNHQGKQDRMNDKRNAPSTKGGKAGSRNVSNRQSSTFYSGQSNRNDNGHQSFNNYNENQRGYNNYQREDRQYGGYNSQNVQAEKAPRFQKKFEGEAKKQQNFNSLPEQQSSYSQNYPLQPQPQQQQQLQNVYSNNRTINDKPVSRSFYSPQIIENITDATANLNFDNQNKFNSMGQAPMQTYQNNYNSYSNNKMNFSDPNFRRNNYPNIKPQQPTPNVSNGQNISQSFYSYPDTNQVKSQQLLRQPNIINQFNQQPPNNQQQNPTNNFSTAGNGFYHQAPNMIGFQNTLVNEQPRKVMPENAREINWNIGDRCLAKYWEDNGYYDAEITGISARTVVVRFLAYGNHEEVLKADCLPANSGGRLYSREGNNINQSENSNRPNRFHQPMYVPPAQRKP